MPYVVPVIAIALVWRWMLDGDFGVVSYALQQIGLIPNDQSPLALLGGAMPSVVSASIWRGFPFAMLIYWAALQGIDQEQYDAAKVDGANTLQEFWYITLPNLRNATIVLLVLRGIWTITYFDLIWLITRGGPAGATETWPIWIYQQAMGLFRFGYASAIGVFMGVLLLIIVVIYVRKSNFGMD
jgi:multiple sugar transport system permease protein